MKACPRCGLGGCEFSERYRFDGKVIPAWVCADAVCRHSEPVRKGDAEPAAVIPGGRREAEAEPQRQMMKSGARPQRSSGLVAKGAKRLKKH